MLKIRTGIDLSFTRRFATEILVRHPLATYSNEDEYKKSRRRMPIEKDSRATTSAGPVDTRPRVSVARSLPGDNDVVYGADDGHAKTGGWGPWPDSYTVSFGSHKRQLVQSKPTENQPKQVPKERGKRRKPVEAPRTPLATGATFVDPEETAIFQELVDIRADKAARKGRVLLEGKRLIADALLAGAKPQTVVFTDPSELEDLPLVANEAQLRRVGKERMATWSGMVTAPGVLAIVSKPDLSEIDLDSQCLPLTVVCDNVRDPNNMGTLLRSLAAAGCQKVFTTKGSCEVWESKVLRGGMGAQFRMQIQSKLDWSAFETHLPPSFSVFLADSSWSSDSEDLPLIPYFDANFGASEHIVLIFGGETHGLSDEARQFASRHADSRALHIGMSRNMDSLNVAVSISVIIFEIRRQLLSKLAESGQK